MSSQGEDWRCRLERALVAGGVIRRVEVIDSTPSTQDAAWSACAGEPGLLLVAQRQTAGRGRLGRAWYDKHGLGLAATFVVGASRPIEALALRAGLASIGAIEHCLGDRAREVGLRWPNDVVERATDRKLSGVLVERREGVWLIGVGINVGHTDLDWPPDLAGRSISLRGMGGPFTREDVSIELLKSLERWHAEPVASVVSAWKARDTLMGTRRAFVHNARHYSGKVVGVSPLDEITIETSDGVVRLPAETTALVHRVL